MKNTRVIIIAMDQPLDSDVHLRRKMANVETRAQRQSSRFPGLDLQAIQEEVNKNLLKLPLLFNGRYMGLPDLMNFLKNIFLLSLVFLITAGEKALMAQLIRPGDLV